MNHHLQRNGVSYQYLAILIGLLVVAISRDKRKLLKTLHTLLALYIATWFFIFPVKWWFRTYIEKPNTAATGYTLAVNSCEYLLDLLTPLTCLAVDESWSLNQSF